MTLPLDEIRNIRFPMARKPQEDGYRASAVDNFIDRVEISYAKLIEDNDSLRAQVTEGGQASDPAVANRINELEGQLEQARAELDSVNEAKANLEATIADIRNSDDSAAGELNELRERIQNYENEIAELRGEVVQARQEAEAAFGQLNAKNEELGDRAEEIAALHAAVAEANGRVENLLNAQGDSDAEREAAWQELNNQLNALREANEGLTAELAAKNSELEARNSELGSVRDELFGAREALQNVPEVVSEPVAVAGVVDGVQRIEVTTTAEASSAVVSLVALATSQAETVLTEAKAESEQLRNQAQHDADQMVNNAREAADALSRETRSESDRIIATANDTAARTTREAQENADGLTARVTARQEELFGGLLADRDDFSGKIEQLKSYEANYRTEIQAHLRKLLDRFGNLEIAPKERLEALEPSTVTPRLDKLLGGE